MRWNSHGYGAHPELQKATELPKAAQEQLGYELLERIDWLSALRADVAIGVHRLEAVQGSASRHLVVWIVDRPVGVESWAV